MKKATLFLLFSLYSVLAFSQGLHRVTIAPAVGKTGITYQVETIRNLTAYPLTTSGYNSFTTALSSGVFNLTLVSANGNPIAGCVIPAGTLPGLSPPGCYSPASTTSAAPSWVAGLRYSHTGTTFTLENSGNVGDVSFNTIPATTTSWGNPDNITVDANQFYGYGVYAPDAPFSRRWQVNFAAGQPYRITTRQEGAISNIYSFTLNPAFGVSNVAITGATTSPPSSTTTGGGSTTVVAGSGTPLAGAHDWQPLNSAVPGDFIATLENSQIKIDLDLKEGTAPTNGLSGGIRRIIDKVDGRNKINLPVYGVGNKDDAQRPDGTLIPLGTEDEGRGVNECLYRNPQPWTLNGVFLQIGDNPNESGDIYIRAAQRLGFGNVNGKLYTNIAPNQWSGNGLRTGESFKKWLAIDNNVVKAWYESSFNRNSSNGGDNVQEANFQEAPCYYANGSQYQLTFYDGDAPYTNGGVRSIILDDNIQQAPGAQYLTENWIAAIDPVTGRGMGIIMETPCTQLGQFDGKGGRADGSDFNANYIAWFPRMTLDKNIVWRHSCLFVVGTVAEIRAIAYQYTSWKQTPEFRFNQPGRQLWSLRNATDPGYQTTRTSWGPITFQNQNVDLWSPAMALNGANKHVYMKYKYTSSTRTNPGFFLRWLRARQSGGGSNGTSLFGQRFPDGSAVGGDYEKLVNLQADGSWHVADYDFTDKQEWKGIISEIRFEVDGAQAAGESIDIEWISGSSTGPPN